MTNEIPIRLGLLAATEVAQSPGGVAEHTELVIFAEEIEEGFECSLLEDIVTALGRVTSDIAQSPNGLLPNIDHRRRQQVDEFWDCTSIDDDLGVLSGTRCDVGQCPSRLKLSAMLPCGGKFLI